MEDLNTDSKPMKIYLENDSFIFEKLNKCISYEKTGNKTEIISNYQSTQTPYTCYGLVGIIDAKELSYLIYIDEAKFVGEYLGAKVYRITKFGYLPTKGNVILPNDFTYIQMLNDFLDRNPLFFSDEIDLTISLQNFEKKKETKSFIFKYTIHQYCWNYFVGRLLDKENLSDFIFPIINGFFGTCKGEEYNPNLQLILIARKDVRRSGMRFLIRGADENGNVANCCENEEILIFKENDNINILSFVQLRGSIPLIWTQEPNLQLNPKVVVGNDFHANYNTFSIHIDELIENYNAVCIINLIDKKKDQKIIGENYKNMVEKYKETDNKKGKNLEFSWFDFHHECRGMKYDNIKRLLQEENIKQCLEHYKCTIAKIIRSNFENYKKQENDSKIEQILISKDLLKFSQIQKGTFRTNCMDSLDRSNVVQSVFGRYFLFEMLNNIKLSLIIPSENIINTQFKNTFENKFKNLWGDHGDCISLAYSGTGAMKRDFVRTGKRTLMGAIDDGILTMKRLFINNFKDGYNQDCHDFFLGALNPKKNQLRQHSLLPLEILLLVAIIIGFNISRLLVPSGSFLGVFGRVLVFLICMVGTFVMCLSFMKKSFIDLHTRHK